jgi:CheY-like chemotaxis protein
MRQVLTNLIGNAIKFTDRGSVTVQTHAVLAQDEQSCQLIIRITDTGIGFDPSRKDALFSPFTQADGSVTRSYGGTGLGLAITRSLLHLMGGDITANSQPGQGACFEVNLPVTVVVFDAAIAIGAQTECTPQRELSDVSIKPGIGHLSVLLVEDHLINRKLAEIMLQRMGYSFVSASDGQEALNYLAKTRFDVVLMDVMMPVMDGMTALRRLRASEADSGRRTPVLMVTAHAMTGDRERFLSEGADGYVSKPMSEANLKKEIEQVMVRMHAHVNASALADSSHR